MKLSKFKLFTLSLLLLIAPALVTPTFVTPVMAAATATLAPQVKFTAMDSNGDPYVGGKLYTFETGGTTPKATWIDSTKETANTNPIALDNRGQADVWIDSSGGAYRFRLDNSDDVTIWTKDNINDLSMVSSYSTLTLPTKSDSLIIYDDSASEVKKLAILNLLGNAHYPDYNETDQGLTGNGSSVKAFVDAIGAKSATLYFRHNSGAATTTYTFSTDETIPANINVVIEKGVILSIANAKTLTINGPFSPGPYQVFSGAGTVVLPYAIQHYPEWYSSGTFTQATIQSALTAIGTSNKATLLLRSGTWTIDANADYSAYKNVTWIIPDGAILKIATTKILTIGGPFQAGLYQVFDCVGTGKVVFGDGAIKEVYPRWWYSGSGSWSSAIQTAINTYKNVYIPKGTYSYDTSLQLANETHLYGDNFVTSVLEYTGTGDGIINPTDTRINNMHLYDFYLKCTNGSPTGTGIHFTKYCSRFVIERLRISGFGIGAIDLQGGLFNSIRNNYLVNNDVKKDAVVYGVRVRAQNPDGTEPATTTVVAHNYIQGVQNTAKTGKGISWEDTSGAGCVDLFNIIQTVDIGINANKATLAIVSPYFEGYTTAIKWHDTLGYTIGCDFYCDVDDIATWSAGGLPSDRRVVPTLTTNYSDATTFGVFGSTKVRGILRSEVAEEIAFEDAGTGGKTLNYNHHVIGCSPNAGANSIINLPACADVKGRVYTIQKNNATTGTVTIDANGTEKIGNAETFVLRKQGQYLTIISDKSNWRIIGGGGEKQEANADTSGATLAALETEVNELKAALRAFGVIKS